MTVTARRRDSDVSEHGCGQRGAQRSTPGARRALTHDRFTSGARRTACHRVRRLSSASYGYNGIRRVYRMCGLLPRLASGRVTPP